MWFPNKRKYNVIGKNELKNICISDIGKNELKNIGISDIGKNESKNIGISAKMS